MNANSAPNEPRDPDNFNLHSRLTVLETRFDTVLPALATKPDLLELGAKFDVELMKVRIDLMKAIHDQTKWLTGLVIVAILGMIGFSVHISSRLPPASTVSSPLTQQPSPQSLPAAAANRP